MEVNITLILQAVHFGCAYYFLRTFLFTPSLAIIEKNEHVKKTLYKNLEQEQHTKDFVLQEYYVKNRAYKKLLLQAISDEATQPFYQKSTCALMSYAVENIEISVQEQKAIEAFLVHNLSQVVKHD